MTFAVFLLVGCGPKLDPLLVMKSEVAQARRDGPQQAPPHVRVSVAPEALFQVASTLTKLDSAHVVPLMMGAKATVNVKLEQPALGIVERADCDCGQVELSTQGRVTAFVDSLLGRQPVANKLGFDATVRGPVKFGLVHGPTGTDFQLEPVRTRGWTAKVTLAEERGILTNDLLSDQISNALMQWFNKPVRLVHVPANIPLRPLAVRLVAAEDPTAVGWLMAKPASSSPVPREANDGWVLSTTEDALLQGARAALASVRQHKRWQLEPRSIALDDGTFRAGLRVHKVARKTKYRDYVVDGSFSVSDRLVIRPENVAETGKRGFGLSLAGPFVKGQVRKRVLRLFADVPSETSHGIGPGTLTWTLRAVDTEGDDVVLRGTVEAALTR